MTLLVRPYVWIMENSCLPNLLQQNVLIILGVCRCTLTILMMCGCNSISVRPRCFAGSRPSAATLMTIALTWQSIISCNNSAWSRRQRYANVTRPRRLALWVKINNLLNSLLHMQQVRWCNLVLVKYIAYATILK